MRITPERLEKLKEEVKRKVRVHVNQEGNPVEISEVEAMEQSARIRKDWDSSRWKKNPFLKWLNTSTFHNHHHQFFKGNYGLYFIFWDY